MNDQELRIACLQLASCRPGADGGSCSAEEMLRAAKLIYEWAVAGQSK